MCSSGENERVNATSWDFDSELSSVTMVRPSKSKEVEPVDNHTPNHLENGRGISLEGPEGVVEGEELVGGDSGTPVAKQPPQLGIDDTAFIEASPVQRRSVVDTAGETGGEDLLESKRGSVISIEGSSGIVVVSTQTPRF